MGASNDRQSRDSIFSPLIMFFSPIIFFLFPPGPLLPEEKVPPVPGSAGPVWVVLPPPEHREGSLTAQLGLPRPVRPLMKEK